MSDHAKGSEPSPPSEREALVEMVWKMTTNYCNKQKAAQIVDAILAAGYVRSGSRLALRPPRDMTAEEAAAYRAFLDSRFSREATPSRDEIMRIAADLHELLKRLRSLGLSASSSTEKPENG